MRSFCFLIVTECPSYTAVHCQRSGLPCCCCPYLEQSALTCHICTPCVCFFEVASRSRLSSSGVHSHDFYCNLCSACAVTVVIFGHLNRSFYLLTLMLNPTSHTCLNVAVKVLWTRCYHGRDLCLWVASHTQRISFIRCWWCVTTWTWKHHSTSVTSQW